MGWRDKIKSTIDLLWKIIQWIVFVFFASLVLQKFAERAGAGDVWIFNFIFMMLGVILVVPGLFKSRLLTGVLRGRLGSFPGRISLSIVIIFLSSINFFGYVGGAYSDYKAYLSLTPEQRREIEAEELRVERELEMQRKIELVDRKSREDEARRLEGLQKSLAEEERNKPKVEVSYDECVKNGVSWFKEIGAYPTLSSGEDAYLKAQGNCTRTTTAFGPWD